MSTSSPETVLHELTDLWVSLGGEGHAESGAGVLRACSMTLVVLTDAGDDAAALGETIAALMPEHPARTILVRLTGESTTPFEAHVQSQCWMPFGGRRQICCEQIEITAPDSALPDVPPFLVPLAAPDLPLILWCRSARAAGHAAFGEIAAIASKVVLDSARFPDASAALHLLANAVAKKHAVGDLAWTRVTRWREALCRAFDDPKLLAGLPRLSGAQVTYGAGEESSARYLAAWLEAAIERVGAKVEPKIASAPALALTLSGDGVAMDFARRDGKLGIKVNGASDCVALPPDGDYSLVREELAILQRDLVFEKTLASAVRLAYPTET